MRFHLCSGALLCLALAPLAQAQEQHSRLQDLIAEALRRNPEILAAQKRYEAARERPRQESSLPDPTLSLGYAGVGKPWPGAGLGSEPTANIGFSYTQAVPYPGKLRLRGQIGSKEADAEREQYHAVERDVALRVRQAFHRLHHTYAAMEVLDRNRELLQSLLHAAEARYSVGKAEQQDIFKIQTQLTILETQREQLLSDRRSRQAEIDALLDRPAGTPVPEPEEMHPHPIGRTLEEIQVNAPATAPEIRRDQKMVERSELALNLARKDSYPDYAFSGGYYNMGGMPPMYEFRADITLPLQFGRRRAEVAEQWQNVAASQHDYTAAARSLHYRVEETYLAAQTAYKLMMLYQDTAIPQAHLALQSSLIAYQNGKADFLSVFTNQIAVVEYEMNYHEQMLNYDLAVAQLEQLSGLNLEE